METGKYINISLNKREVLILRLKISLIFFSGDPNPFWYLLGEDGKKNQNNTLTDDHNRHRFEDDECDMSELRNNSDSESDNSNDNNLYVLSNLYVTEWSINDGNNWKTACHFLLTIEKQDNLCSLLYITFPKWRVCILFYIVPWFLSFGKEKYNTLLWIIWIFLYSCIFFLTLSVSQK
jgi:hypothetical protein